MRFHDMPVDGVLLCSFVWADTKEGQEYWRNVLRKIQGSGLRGARAFMEVLESVCDDTVVRAFIHNVRREANARSYINKDLDAAIKEWEAVHE